MLIAQIPALRVLAAHQEFAQLQGRIVYLKNAALVD